MAEKIDEYFTATIAALPRGATRGMVGADEPITPTSRLTVQDVLDLFDAQLGSRHLDLAARWLRSARRGLLHDRLVRPRGQRRRRRGAAAHRPGAAALPLGRLLPAAGPRRLAGAATRCATCCSGVAAPRPTSRSPAAGTRCSAAAPRVIPQTSTIASHLPRAVGRGVRASAGPRSSGVDTPWPRDAIVVCSFGDASVEPLDRGRRDQRRDCTPRYQGLPLPLLFVCEDNGIGISVRTPDGLDRRDASATGRGCDTSPPTAADLADAYDAADAGRRAGCARTASPRSCTCARCGSWAMPAPTSRPPTARPARSRPTTPATRCSARRSCLIDRPVADAGGGARPLRGRAARGASASPRRSPSRLGWTAPRR